MRRRSFLAGAASLSASSLAPLVSTTLATGCQPAHPPIHDPNRPGSVEDLAARRSFDQLAERYEHLMREHGLAEWTRYAGQGGTDAASAKREADQMQALREQELKVVGQAAKDAILVGLDSREQILWQRGALGLAIASDPRTAELTDALEKTINDFTFEVDGKRVTRGELRKMARSPDAAARRAQRKAFGALHKIAAPTAKALLVRRNELAREHRLKGGFFDATLALRGVDPASLRATFDTLSNATRELFAAILSDAKKSSKLEKINVYDLDFALRSLGEAPEERFAADRALGFARELWRDLGVDLDQPKVRIDVRDFAFAGQTISLDVPNDVRAVVNPAPGAGFYGTLLHELGHAFAATRNRETRPVFKGYEWVPGMTEPGYDEGVGEVFGRLLDEPFVLDRLGMSDDEKKTFLASRRRSDIVALRRRLVAYHFEKAALENPAQDLDALERKLDRELLGVERDDGDEAVWATSPFLATYPVYIQSYTIAALLSCQVRAHLRATVGERFATPAVGALLGEKLVSDGARTTLDQKLTRLTGAPLKPDAYLAWVKG